MLRSIIIDDELKSREGLKKLIVNFCKEVEVCTVCENVAEGLAAIAKYKPDVIFLDVQMRGETGFDLLSQLKNIDFEIVFTTAYSEYAIKAIKFSAIEYLLKPIDLEELIIAVGKVEKKKKPDTSDKLKQLMQNLETGVTSNSKIALPTAEGLCFIKGTEIMYCKADGNYTEIHMADGKKHLVCRQLKEYEDMLADHGFFRIHHSSLINLEYIKNYVKGDGGYVVMTNDVSLDVSRRKKEAFLERIGYK